MSKRGEGTAFATRKTDILIGIYIINMKPSPPGRFKDLHLLLDRQKQAEQSEDVELKVTPAELDQARVEMEQNYQDQLWKKQHRIQSFFGIRLTPIAIYGMILVFGAAYFWLKYGTLGPFPQAPPRFTVTQWLKEP